MSSAAILALCTALVACCSGTDLKDGPCPSPSPTSDFDVNKMVGRWLDTYSTYGLLTLKHQYQCVENFVNLADQDGSFYLNATYKENNASDVSVLRRKFVPVGSQPGKYMTQTLSPRGSGCGLPIKKAVVM